MHIVLANQWFPPESGWGGVALYNYTIARACTALGHRVTVITSRLSPMTPAENVIDGIRVRRLDVGAQRRWHRFPVLGSYVRPAQQLVHSWRVAGALRQLHREQPIDVIEFAEVNAEGFFYARAPQAPIVVRCHTPTFVLAHYYSKREMPFDTRITSWVERDLIRRAQELVAPSRHLAQITSVQVQTPLHRINIIPNPLCLEPFKPVARRSGDHPITILYVGRLERFKGVTVLNDAIPRIVERLPEARFVLVGEDRPSGRGTSQRAELEGCLKQAHVRSHVHFAGSSGQPWFRRWYELADICVVPSMYESFSYTCAQAMAMIKPVVASRVGGIPETLGDVGCGILVTPGDVSELTAAIVQLAREPETRARMGQAGRERVRNAFDPLKIAQQNIAVYERARVAFSHQAT